MHQTRSGEQHREMVLAAGFSQAALAASLLFGRTVSSFQVIGLSGQVQGYLILQLQGSWVPLQTCPLAWELVLGAFPWHQAPEADVSPAAPQASYQLCRLLLLIKLSRHWDGPRMTEIPKAKGPVHKGVWEPWNADGKPWTVHRAGSVPASHQLWFICSLLIHPLWQG